MRLRSGHQFLRRTEPKRSRPKLRSRPLVNEAARNEVATKLEQIKKIQVTKSTQGRNLR